MLGLIAKVSKIPFIREMCCIDMVARSVKNLFRIKMKTSILHFKSVGATNIDDQMKDYAVTIFNYVLGFGEKSEKVREKF